MRRISFAAVVCLAAVGGCGGEPDAADPSPPARGAAPGAEPPAAETSGVDAPAPIPAAPVEIELAFKLDPRLTDGLYLGERWVSPPVFSATLVAGGYVEARARCLAPSGGTSGEAAGWSVRGPDAFSVERARGEEVRLRVWGPGAGVVVVACGARTRELRVDAVNDARGGLRIDISQ